jgi:hypothetical protein
MDTPVATLAGLWICALGCLLLVMRLSRSRAFTAKRLDSWTRRRIRERFFAAGNASVKNPDMANIQDVAAIMVDGPQTTSFQLPRVFGEVELVIRIHAETNFVEFLENETGRRIKQMH